MSPPLLCLCLRDEHAEGTPRLGKVWQLLSTTGMAKGAPWAWPQPAAGGELGEISR